MKEKFNLLKRCIHYARKLNKISHLLDDFEKRKNLSFDCKELIKEIDTIL